MENNLSEKRKRKVLEVLDEYETTKGNRQYKEMLDILAKKHFYCKDYIRQMITIGRRLRRE